MRTGDRDTQSMGRPASREERVFTTTIITDDQIRRASVADLIRMHELKVGELSFGNREAIDDLKAIRYVLETRATQGEKTEMVREYLRRTANQIRSAAGMGPESE